MANLKIVDADQLNAGLKKVADAIRAKNDTTEPLSFPDGMEEAVASIKQGEDLNAELDEQTALIAELRTKLMSAGGSSGGKPNVKEKDVNFYDYDGTLLHSYTVEEAQALSELPELPTQEGLICQGWNWSLDDIKAHNRAVDVGATYITNDGKTRLYIKIAAEGRMDVPLYFQQSVENGVAIDWGDGSATETLSGTYSYGEYRVNTTHTYASVGEHIITLDPIDGCTLSLGHDTSGYCVMGNTSGVGQVYCNMLHKVEIGNGVTSIEDYTFNKCYFLANIVMPNGVTSIGEYAIKDCYSLANIVIPNGVTSMDNYVFQYCYSLEKIVIPNSVQYIRAYGFRGCSSLDNIVIPNGVINIDGYVFYDCQSLKSIIIPDGAKGVNIQTFNGCNALSSIVIPNSVTSIGNDAFKECYSLANIVIPNGVTSIGTNAFSRCYSLASIVIPNGVTSIGTSTFQNCSGIKVIDFSQHTSVPTLGATNAFGGIPSDCEIRVPMALVDEWKAATNWSTYANYIVGV